MHINISLLSDFFIKLLRLPMGFFDTKLTGDLLQRMNDHSRVESFLTQQTLGMMFTMVSFLVFGTVLAVYDWLIFAVFMAGSVAYAVWIASFLEKRKVIDYEIFECSALNLPVRDVHAGDKAARMQQTAQKRMGGETKGTFRDTDEIAETATAAGGGKRIYQ